MKTSKRLLSVALSAVLLFGSAFSALADDAVTTVQYISGTVTASNVSANAGDTEVTVPVTITFENKQASPHGMFDISAEGATLKSATLKSFDNDNADPDAPDEKVIYIDTKGVNAEKGRVIVEAATDDLKKPLTSNVEIDVVLGFDTALEAGQVITVTIDNIQATNLSEAPWTGMSAVNGKITVEADVTHEAAADWSYDDTNHWHACVVEGCTEHIGENAYDYAEHSYDAGVVTDPTTTSKGYTTYTCECGYSYTADETDVLAVEFVPYYDPAASTIRIHYSYPDTGIMKTKLTDARDNNRTLQYVLVLDGAPWEFSMSGIKSGNALQTSGLAITDTFVEAQLYIRINWEIDGVAYHWDTNVITFQISDLIAGGYTEDTTNTTYSTIVPLSDEILTSYDNMIAEWSELSDTYYLDIATITQDDGYVTYSGCKYYPKTGKVEVVYDYSGTTFAADILTPAKGTDGKQRTLTHKFSLNGGDPYAFVMSGIKSGQSLAASGFSIDDLDNIEWWIHVDGLTSDDVVVNYDTNAVTIDVNSSIIANSDDSTFTAAYAEYLDLIK